MPIILLIIITLIIILLLTILLITTLLTKQEKGFISFFYLHNFLNNKKNIKNIFLLNETGLLDIHIKVIQYQ